MTLRELHQKTQQMLDELTSKYGEVADVNVVCGDPDDCIFNNVRLSLQKLEFFKDDNISSFMYPIGGGKTLSVAVIEFGE